MTRFYFTLIDPSGNLTALVETKVPKDRRAVVAKKILEEYPNIEQVGFNVNGNLEMMGGELSLLGTLTFGYWLSLQGCTQKRTSLCFRTSAMKSGVKFKNCGKDYGMITFYLPKIKVSKIDNFGFVDLGNIAYLLLPQKVSSFEADFNKYRKKINRDAWGIVYYQKNRIWPFIYVEKNGIVLEKRLENACGSGSLAYFLISGQKKIIQPSGQVLEIKKLGNRFSLKGKVKIISKQSVTL